MELSELWTCAECGTSAKVPIERGVVQCKCGSTEGDSSRVPYYVSLTHRQNYRLAICETCDQYIPKKRCKEIDLGCSQTFAKVTRDPTGICPLDRWKMPPITTRHCLYHVYPYRDNDDWIDNVNVLGLWANQAFNGRRIAAIATGRNTHVYDVAARRLETIGFECHEYVNDERLREVATFVPLLTMVGTADPSTAIFYAHTKGNTTRDGRKGARIWRNVGYRELVREWEPCTQLLEEYVAVGIHRISWNKTDPIPYPTGLRHGNWMFAGTYFWFRADRVYSLPNWDQIPDDRYAAEAWLSGLFDPHETKSVYQLWPEYQFPTPSPYQPYVYPQQDQTWEPLSSLASPV